MNEAERRAQAIAATQHHVLLTSQAVAVGMPKRTCARRIAEGRSQKIFRGAQLIGPGPVLWTHRAQAAVLLAGDLAGLSARASGVLWTLDECRMGPIDVVVRYPHDLQLPGVITHRTRLLSPADLRRREGITTTRIERTIVDLGRYLPPLALEKAMESAFRQRHTTVEAVERYLADVGHLLPGGRRLEEVLLARGRDAAVAGSAAEVELIAGLRDQGIEPPVRQYEIDLGGGWKVKLDLCWPWRRFITEYHGTEGHISGPALAYDLERQNALEDAGWGYRAYGGGAIRRDPVKVARLVAAAVRRHPIIDADAPVLRPVG
jgi:hypothetical protein